MKILSSKYVFKKTSRRLLVWVFDLLGVVCFFWLRWLRAPKTFKRILVIRLDQMGDVVLSLPAIEALKACFPGARVDCLVASWARELVENHPAVSNAYTFKHSYFSEHFSKWRALQEWLCYVQTFRRIGYDLAIDFRGDIRNALLLFLSGVKRRVGRGLTGGGFLLTDLAEEKPAKHQLEKNLDLVRALGCSVESSSPPIYYPASALATFKGRHLDFFTSAQRPWILFHIGSGYPSKQWPVDRFFSLVSRVLENEMGSVLLVGQEDEERLARPFLRERDRLFNFMRETTLSELCALIDACDIFIGNDSGPTHIAAALGKKVITIFSGTNDYQVWQPRGKAVHVLRHAVPCSPCHEKVCPLPRHDCMEDVTLEEVFEKVRELIHG